MKINKTWAITKVYKIICNCNITLLVKECRIMSSIDQIK